MKIAKYVTWKPDGGGSSSEITCVAEGLSDYDTLCGTAFDEIDHQPVYHKRAKVTCLDCKQIIKIVKSLRSGNENS